ncbi:MAG TPA: class I SAM-dependent methyltransferase [Candidatus Sumerlaeota bacterium]|nr:class I SAM-dependent methyltransferase [Candidatus Sumerlaeota bacterium]
MKPEQPARTRTEKEAEYFDSYFQGKLKKRSAFESWLCALSPFMPNGVSHILGAAGDVKGKRILEMGCGAGYMTRVLLEKGAQVSAIDISAEAIHKLTEQFKQYIPAQLNASPMDACQLQFPDDTFDFVFGVSILHHVDLMTAAGEIRRVLKPGGRGLFTEPLAHNLISNIYRRFTPSIRTENERPLTYDEIRRMAKGYSSFRCEEFALLNLLSSAVYLVTFSQNLKRKSGEYLCRIEKPFLRVFKPLRRFSGLVLIEFVK